MDIVAKIRAVKDLSEALGCLVRHVAAIRAHYTSLRRTARYISKH